MIHHDIGIVYNFQKHLKPTYQSWILKEANYILVYKFKSCCTVATNAVQLLMAEILHQLIGSLSSYLQGFSTSQVVQDFFHQQKYQGWNDFLEVWKPEFNQSTFDSRAMLRAKSCCNSRGVWATKTGGILFKMLLRHEEWSLPKFYPSLPKCR